MSDGLYDLSLVWLRRDLRLDDNAALYEACAQSRHVCLAFVVDRTLLARASMGAPLVTFFFDALAVLRDDLRARGSDVVILDGEPAEALSRLAQDLGVQALFFNEDYEPHAIERDRRVAAALEAFGRDVHVSLDHVYFGAGEVMRSTGDPYRMFTPYKRRWLDQRLFSPRLPYPSARASNGKLLRRDVLALHGSLPRPETFGFARFNKNGAAGESAAGARLEKFLDCRLERYHVDRNTPAIDGTSRLSADLRAGTIGIRRCVESAFAKQPQSRAGAEAWISELIWRDFYQMIYKTFPYVKDEPFLSAARHIQWQQAGAAFEAWCDGKTGYPIVDAAMRQLNGEGWMHNRLRMIAASFLTKHLLIDWRLGERYFERHLADADPAQNNGGWQWAASTGTDAAPYFRIFNPSAQSKQFDPDGVFIKRYLPEFGTARYPTPIIDHAAARQRAIAAFAAAFNRPS